LVYDVGGRGDASFNDAAATGLARASKELGIATRALTPDRGGENRHELLRLLAEEEFGLVIAVGFVFADAVKSVARDFPHTAFAIVDAVVEGDNIVSLTFSEEQGSYLVGAAAALTSQAGKVGFIGGVESGPVRKFEAGYLFGARSVKPDIGITVKYISQPPDFSGFSDPSRAKEIALGMYAAGADVVYHVAGGSGIGLFEASRQASSDGPKVFAIGVDSDQYRAVDDALSPFVLTSMLKRVDVAVYETIKAYQQGHFTPGHVRFDLRSGGVDFARSGSANDDIEQRLDELKRLIISGEIQVPTKP
jgi:basic membrane protein A